MESGGDPGKYDFLKSLAGVTALAGALAAFATATGAFDRMQRNHPYWTVSVFAVALLAGVLLMIGSAWKTVHTAWFAVPAVGLFLAAFVVGLIVLLRSQTDRPTPSVSVSVNTGSQTSVTGAIRAEAMKSDEIVHTSVYGATTVKEIGRPTQEVLLYRSFIGPNASGTVDTSFEAPVPDQVRYVSVLAWATERPGACWKKRHPKETPGCVFVYIPTAPKGGTKTRSEGPAK